MKQIKPVSISKGAFAFCRYTIAIMLWVSIILQVKWLVLATCIILILSYVLKVSKAPLVFLYDITIEKLKPSEKEVLDENGISFAHLVGSIFSGLCVVVLYFGNPIAGWILTGLLALLKTSAAFGRCSALKLYNCMNGGNCCRIGKKIRSCRNV